MEIKLLQWNVWYQESPSNIIDTLRWVNADILCLQELRDNIAIPKATDLVQRFATELGYQYYYFPVQEGVIESTSEFQANGIFSRFPIVENHWYPIHNPAAHSYDEYCQEARFYIEVELRIAEQSVLVGTTHMSYTQNFQESPPKQAETDRLLEIVSQRKKRYIFTGDLNSLPDSYVVKRLSQELIHAGPDFAEKTWTTKEHDFGEVIIDELGWRMDYVFCSHDVKIVEAKTVSTGASDHLPILVTIEC